MKKIKSKPIKIADDIESTDFTNHSLIDPRFIDKLQQYPNELFTTSNLHSKKYLHKSTSAESLISRGPFLKHKKSLARILP